MKRITSMILTMLFVFGCCFNTVLAADSEIMPLASPTIKSQNVTLNAGTKSGELKISYSISAIDTANAIGVSTIEIYKTNGSYVTTIYGTTSNGLVRNSARTNSGIYTYTGATSGQAYYAIVTLYATIGSVSDSVSITTATVKAP